jgi:rhodanese-related sulfurtransferase/uncharacterized membrane protein YedE/YeeE
MMAPFFKYGLFGDEISLVVAFLIGIAFGFVLERAGFGNARVLAAQFYFRDLRVLKVMFTAIITAMVGLYVLARLGALDLSLVYLTPTLVWPQIVGGLVLGVGFIVGGYCPGTSCVSAATGRVDGMVYVAGMIGGLLGFAEVYPRIATFAKSTALGRVTLPEFFNVPHGVVVLLVVVMALGAFLAAELAEWKIGRTPPNQGALLSPSRAINPARRLAAALLALGVFAAFAGNPNRGSFVRVVARQLALDAASNADRVSPAQLADSLLSGRAEFVIVDLRSANAFAEYHLPGAINVPLATLSADIAPRDERLVCYGERDADGAQAALLLRSLRFSGSYALTGGLEGWRDEVLFPIAPAADAAAAQRVDFARRAAIAEHFGGAPRGAAIKGPAATELPKLAPPPSESGNTRPASPRKKKEGC